MENGEISPVNQFQELYTLRDTLRIQQEQATSITAPVYSDAIESANVQLTELAKSPEVQQYLLELGGVAVRGFMELEELKSTGLVSEDTITEKNTVLEEMQREPGVSMAFEFLEIAGLPKVEPIRPRVRLYATEKQVEYAKTLGLDEITQETPRGTASKLIRDEVKRQGKKELKEGGWALFDGVIHPKYGECEIVKIHESISRVTLEPVKGGKKVVVAAANLATYGRPDK